MTGLTVPLYRAYVAFNTAERYLRLQWRHPQVLRRLNTEWDGAWKALRRISFAALARRLLRDPAVEHWRVMVGQVSIEGEPRGLATGYIMATFHSPWDSLLMRLPVFEGFLVLANKEMASILGALYVARDCGGLRKLVRHLKSGGRVAVMMDAFVEEGRPAGRFLGAPVRVRAGAIRLAAYAQVPVVPLSTTYARGCLRVRFGPLIPVNAGVEQEAAATCAVLECFERAVREDPAAWRYLLGFLKKCVTQYGHSPELGYLKSSFSTQIRPELSGPSVTPQGNASSG